MSKLTPEQEAGRVEAIYKRRSLILNAIDFEINELKNDEKQKNAYISGLRQALSKVQDKLETAEDELFQLEEEREAFETAKYIIAEYAEEP